MELNIENWLPHLRDSIPKEAFGYSVSMYSIALEGWRRGLTLKFINNNKSKSVINYSLSHEGRTHMFMGSRGDKVSSEAIRICRKKDLTKKYLEQGNVPIPKGKIFLQDVSNDKIIQYGEELGFPLVLKPSNGMGGRGVIAGINDPEELFSALTYVREDLNYKEVILEKFVTGKDFRVYVVGDKVVGAIKRIPANVIGDGKNTIKDLIREKNRLRNRNPALYGSTIKLNKELYNMLNFKNYTLSSIPKKGEVIYLKPKNNISAGGDPIDVTDKLTKELKEIAINATKAIPGMAQSGVDLMVDLEKNRGVVIEVNSIPSIRTHLFPMKGIARDIPKAIIDYYFPETKSLSKSSGYFEIQSVFEAFDSGIAQEITIPRLHSSDLIATRFIISGQFNARNFESWICENAHTLNLNGYVKELKNSKFAVIISGTQESIDQFRNIIKSEHSKHLRIESVTEKVRKSPVKMGFEVIKSEKNARKRTLKEAQERSKLKKIAQRKEEAYYEKKYKEMLNSTSWRITKPIRLFGALLKKINK